MAWFREARFGMFIHYGQVCGSYYASFGLKIGLYSSLMDWHHPDSLRCANDMEARMRSTKYIEDLNVELLSNYGKIDF